MEMETKIIERNEYIWIQFKAENISDSNLLMRMAKNIKKPVGINTFFGADETNCSISIPMKKEKSTSIGNL